jgi:hypothetical protein
MNNGKGNGRKVAQQWAEEREESGSMGRRKGGKWLSGIVNNAPV